MAVPIIGATLQDVVDELGGGQTSLQACIDDAVEGDYDPTYYTAPATSLAEFRGYTVPLQQKRCVSIELPHHLPHKALVQITLDWSLSIT
jgi:hypothetical protein